MALHSVCVRLLPLYVGRRSAPLYDARRAMSWLVFFMTHAAFFLFLCGAAVVAIENGNHKGGDVPGYRSSMHQIASSTR